MVELADLRQWDPAALDQVYRLFSDAEQELMHSGEDFIGAGRRLDSWEGKAAEAARGEQQGLRSALDHGVAGLRLLLKTVAQAMDAIPAVQRSITEAEELARKYGFRVGENGEITDTLTNPKPHDSHPEDRATAREEVKTTLAQAVRTATDIDHDLTRVLDRVGEGEVGTGNETTMAAAAAHGAQAQALTLPEPPANATAAQNAGWWASLSPNARALLIGNSPGLIGGRDGLPATARDQANRTLLTQQQGNLRDQRNTIQHQIDGLRHYPNGDIYLNDQQKYDDLNAQLDKINGKLQGLGDIENRLTSTASAPESSRHYLLDISTNGDGQAVVSKGNPDTARNVATHVPGTGHDLSTIEDDLRRSDRMQVSATKSDPGSTTAVITWMGYDAPDALPNATQQHYAQDAKVDMASFQEGLRIAHEGAPSHNTVVGHSYGFVTAGIAARDVGLPVDDLVAVAAPGATVDHASQLHISPDHVWATVADKDLVNNQPFHGEDPTDAEFGGRMFDSSPAKSDWPMSEDAHSEYWDRRNVALPNMGHIIAGKYGQVI